MSFSLHTSVFYSTNYNNLLHALHFFLLPLSEPLLNRDKEVDERRKMEEEEKKKKTISGIVKMIKFYGSALQRSLSVY